jgi:hypothetical protein
LGLLLGLAAWSTKAALLELAWPIQLRARFALASQAWRRARLSPSRPIA